MSQFSSPTELLRSELLKRISRNPKYSLRAFAKVLRMSPATLSLILSGKHRLSLKHAQSVAAVLGLSPEEASRLKTQCGGLHHEPLFNTSLDIFAMLSDWYHYAILSLTEIDKSSIDDFRWVSKQIGISVIEAKSAFERLKRLNMIEIKNKKWRQAQAPIRVGREISISAARRFQKQLLERAIKSLEEDPSETRDITSLTFAMRKQDLEWASHKITVFRRRLTRELENRNDPDSVFNLTIQLIPVTLHKERSQLKRDCKGQIHSSKNHLTHNQSETS